MENRHQVSSISRALTLTVLLNGCATIFCAMTLLRIPSDAKNAFLFGLSRERLLMTAGFLLLLGINLLSFFLKEKLYRWFSQPAVFRIIAGAVWVSLFLLLMPAYRFDRLAAYYTRLQPYILWVFLTSLCWDFCVRFCRNRFAALRETFIRLKQYRRPILFCGLGIGTLIVFIEITGIGKTEENALWNKNGIPLTSMQLYVSLFAAILFRKINRLNLLSRKKKILHFFLIWLCAAVIWNLAPLSSHFFAPGPYEPDSVYYPYSDATSYDMAAQAALHGWGFNFHRSVLKPVVSLISFVTHAACGNDYNIALRLQSALYGVLPAIIYLFGAEIGGMSCGFLAAGFSLLKEWNALNSHTVLTINSRLTMSEFLMQILFASFCLAIFRWLKKDGRELLHAAAAGGFLCLGIFTRYNFLAFLPASLVLLFLRYRKNLRSFVKPLCAFLLVLCLAPMPYILSNNAIVKEFSRTISDVLISQRFQEAESTETAENSEIAHRSTADSFDGTEQPFSNETPEFSETPIAAGKNEVDFNTGQITNNKTNFISNKYFTIFYSILNHGVHNWISSVLTLPMQGTFDELEQLYQNEEGRLWSDYWKGEYTPVQWGWLIGWTILGAIALGCLIEQEKLAGFSILYFWLVYSFSIGFSRSSGGRYVVPCNWIPMLLLAYGMTLLLNRGSLPLSQKEKLPAAAKPLLSGVGIGAGFACVFCLFYIFDNLIPAQRIASEQSDLEIMKERLSGEPGAESIDWDQVREQEEKGELHISHGITLYPRFYYYRVGEHNYVGATGWKDYSRMTFFGINDDGNRKILINEFILPQMVPMDEFPQDSVFHLISCKTDNGYEDVLAVTLDTDAGETYTYLRDPLPDFSCPVAEPRCISIDQCE